MQIVCLTAHFFDFLGNSYLDDNPSYVPSFYSVLNYFTQFFSIIHDFSLLFISFPLSISNSYFHFSNISMFFDLIYFFSLKFTYFFNVFNFFHIYKKIVPVDQFKIVKLTFFCIIFFNIFLSYFLFAGKAIIMLFFFHNIQLQC